MYMCASVYVCMYMIIHKLLCTCMYVCVCVCVYIHSYIHTPWNMNLSCQWSVFSPTNISFYAHHLRISKEWYYILCIHNKCWVCAYVLFMFDCIIHNCLSMSHHKIIPTNISLNWSSISWVRSIFCLLMFTILHIYNNSWVCIYVSQSFAHVMVHCIALVWVCVESEV